MQPNLRGERDATLPTVEREGHVWEHGHFLSNPPPQKSCSRPSLSPLNYLLSPIFSLHYTSQITVHASLVRLLSNQITVLHLCGLRIS